MGPENTFISSVHKHLSKTVYREKMHNEYRGGTFDVWYSGNKADMWVEYKWIAKAPQKGQVVPALSPLQLEWGTDRSAEGRSVAVIVGCPDGGVIFGIEECVDGISVTEFTTRISSRSEIAAFIERSVTRRKDVGNKKDRKGGTR